MKRWGEALYSSPKVPQVILKITASCNKRITRVNTEGSAPPSHFFHEIPFVKGRPSLGVF